MREQIERTFCSLEFGLACAIRLELDAAHAVGQSQIAGGGTWKRAQDRVQCGLVGLVLTVVRGIEITPYRAIRDMQLSNAETTLQDFSAHEGLAAPVGFGLRHIADVAKVKLARISA